MATITRTRRHNRCRFEWKWGRGTQRVTLRELQRYYAGLVAACATAGTREEVRAARVEVAAYIRSRLTVLR